VAALIAAFMGLTVGAGKRQSVRVRMLVEILHSRAFTSLFALAVVLALLISNTADFTPANETELCIGAFPLGGLRD
jgi:hypothetical protein